MTNNSLFQNPNPVHSCDETDAKSQETSSKSTSTCNTDSINHHDVNSDFFDEIIHAYTRAQAIEDGALVDVSLRASQAGFKYPMAITRAAYDVYIDWNDEDSKRQGYQNSVGRLWDILFNLRLLINRMPPKGGLFTFLCIPRGLYSKLNMPVSVQLKVLIGLGDNSEPVITIMLPNQD